MWRCIAASVPGAAHEQGGCPCEDACALASAITPKGERLLIAALSDGAGSAPLAELGAQFTTTQWIKRASEILWYEGVPPRKIVYQLLDALRDGLADLSNQYRRPLDNFACTFLGAIISDSISVFLSVGDGAWVIRQNSIISSATWPTQGEYPNETVFLTSDDWHDSVHISFQEKVDAVAGFTDGIEHLALDYKDHQAHTPFFAPMFAQFESSKPDFQLNKELTQFLRSPAIRARTQDDTTLMLAVKDGSNLR